MSLLCRASVWRTVANGVSRRFLATGTRTALQGISETVKPRSISDAVSQSWGRALVAGGCVAGIGGLCFYGLGLAPEAGAVDRAMFWPPMVKERVQNTYTVRFHDKIFPQYLQMNKTRESGMQQRWLHKVV